jgi:4-deoxy-L-threo-5-hexosulose-uronate ketol-isomerase
MRTAPSTQSMSRRDIADRHGYRALDAAALRRAFLIDQLFVPGRATLVQTDLERAIVVGVVPLDEALAMPDTFAERREAGVINLGGCGTITVADAELTLETGDGAYLGRGTRSLSFSSRDRHQPAEFYLLSFPAHAALRTTHIPRATARRIDLGCSDDANRRTIRQYIHPDGVASCQLVMGVTELMPGSVWNTFPPHRHERRSEVYCYFDLPKDGLVLHLMGEPQETRHLVVRDRDVVLSPPWSLHTGVGSGAYRFVWGMGGENQQFDDMQPVGLERLA